MRVGRVGVPWYNAAWYTCSGDAGAETAWLRLCCVNVRMCVMCKMNLMPPWSFTPGIAALKYIHLHHNALLWGSGLALPL